MEPTTAALHLAIGFPLALLYGNAIEWVMHRFVLHGLGRLRASFWSFHWYEHHNVSRRRGMYDPDYEQLLTKWNGQTKELLALFLAGLAHLPLLPYAPGFFLGVLYCGANYYRVHRRAHLDPAWARENLPWHVDHHMGPNQDANWCVTRPWFDTILGTRIPYVGTDRAAKDLARREAREQQLAVAA